MINFFVRLLLFVPFIVAYTVGAIVVCLYCGIAWVFTGTATVKVTWPDMR